MFTSRDLDDVMSVSMYVNNGIIELSYGIINVISSYMLVKTPSGELLVAYMPVS